MFYVNLPSAAPHSSEIPVPKPTEKLEDISEVESQAYDEDFHGVLNRSENQLSSQLELKDLVRDLGLSKDFCRTRSNVPGSTDMYNAQYDMNEWMLFIDSSERRFKSVLLHNGSMSDSVPLRPSAYLKECRDNLALILTKMKYKDSGGTIYGDLKMLSILCGQ
ncbi:hypothetical protein AVEN_27418-1 [Araneus ventricosus]|uniref:Uncharacterized protein n=1 Tax=Araneus ventricosus TaxID=182803 RepID=A0A4Y2EID4_ARAVE|nr:hypothetical protein AVEN_27418-1 [Araneus ventricosus]